MRPGPERAHAPSRFAQCASAEFYGRANMVNERGAVKHYSWAATFFRSTLAAKAETTFLRFSPFSHSASPLYAMIWTHLPLAGKISSECVSLLGSGNDS